MDSVYHIAFDDRIISGRCFVRFPESGRCLNCDPVRFLARCSMRSNSFSVLRRGDSSTWEMEVAHSLRCLVVKPLEVCEAAVKFLKTHFFDTFQGGNDE